MNLLENVTQQNAAMFEETNAVTMMLSQQTQRLITKDLDVFLAGARASGLVARLAELLDAPERLTASHFHFDARGRAIRISADFQTATLHLELFAGGHPDNSARVLDGAKLIEALAD